MERTIMIRGMPRIFTWRIRTNVFYSSFPTTFEPPSRNLPQFPRIPPSTPTFCNGIYPCRKNRSTPTTLHDFFKTSKLRGQKKNCGLVLCSLPVTSPTLLAHLLGKIFVWEKMLIRVLRQLMEKSLNPTRPLQPYQP